MAKLQFASSNDEPDAGRDEQQVYSELKLPLGKRLKMGSPNHAPSRAEGMKVSDSPPSPE